MKNKRCIIFGCGKRNFWMDGNLPPTLDRINPKMTSHPVSLSRFSLSDNLTISLTILSCAILWSTRIFTLLDRVNKNFYITGSNRYITYFKCIVIGSCWLQLWSMNMVINVIMNVTILIQHKNQTLHKNIHYVVSSL